MVITKELLDADGDLRVLNVEKGRMAFAGMP